MHKQQNKVPFFIFLSSADFFSKSKFFEIIFQEYHISVKQIESRSSPTFFGPDL